MCDCRGLNSCAGIWYQMVSEAACALAANDCALLELKLHTAPVEHHPKSPSLHIHPRAVQKGVYTPGTSPRLTACASPSAVTRTLHAASCIVMHRPRLTARRSASLPHHACLTRRHPSGAEL